MHGSRRRARRRSSCCCGRARSPSAHCRRCGSSSRPAASCRRSSSRNCVARSPQRGCSSCTARRRRRRDSPTSRRTRSWTKPGSIGKGIPGVELRCSGEDGEAVAPGERGEIYARGRNISPGYFEDPAGSAAKFTSLGLRTGDLAVVDDDGYIYIVDRRDDFIKSWGHRVSSQEVEAVALRGGAARVGGRDRRPGRRAGEAVVLLVVARPGAEVRPGRGAGHLPAAPAEAHGAPLGACRRRAALQREREDRQAALARDRLDAAHRGRRGRRCRSCSHDDRSGLGSRWRRGNAAWSPPRRPCGPRCRERGRQGKVDEQSATGRPRAGVTPGARRTQRAPGSSSATSPSG